jgi:hypothetical protein
MSRRAAIVVSTIVTLSLIQLIMFGVQRDLREEKFIGGFAFQSFIPV